MILARFILRAVALRILAALAVLFAILQILDLLDATTDVLDRGLGAAGVAQYAVLRAPGLIVQALPIAVLAGSLLAFAQLARESAIIAMRASGISIYRIVGSATPVALAVVAAHLALAQVVAPVTDAAFERWWRASEPSSERGDPATRSFRVGPDIVTATADIEDDARLNDIRIYRRGPDGRLLTRTTAFDARFIDGGWVLSAAQTVTFSGDGGTVRADPSLTWATTLRPVDIETVFGDATTVSTGEARRALREGAALRSPAFYEMQLQRAWAAPFASLIMLLLAAPVALVNFRGGTAPTVMALSLGAGLLYLVVDGLLAAVGESGAVPAVLAAWGAPVVFAASALLVLLREEG